MTVTVLYQVHVQCSMIHYHTASESTFMRICKMAGRHTQTHDHLVYMIHTMIHVCLCVMIFYRQQQGLVFVTSPSSSQTLQVSPTYTEIHAHVHTSLREQLRDVCTYVTNNVA